MLQDSWLCGYIHFVTSLIENYKTKEEIKKESVLKL